MELYRTLFNRVEELERAFADMQLKDEGLMTDAWVTDIASDGSHI
jgi:hypothetical protein